LHNRGYGFGKELIDFVNRDAAIQELSMDKMDNDPLHENYRSLLIELLQNNKLDAASKISLLNTTKVPLKITSFEWINDSVIEEMEKQNLIQQDTNTLNLLMKANMPAFIKQFNKHMGIESAYTLLKALNMDYNAYHELLLSDDLKTEMKEAIYDSIDLEARLEFLLDDYHIPATVLEKFKLSAGQLHEVAGKVPYVRSITGLFKANKELLTEEMVIKFLQPLPDPFRKIANRQGKVLPLSDEMITLLNVLQTAGILVENHEVKQKEISVTYLNEV
ncbi:MAG TPA: hypothetical protein VIM79_23705, partial [Niastella sp.]